MDERVKGVRPGGRLVHDDRIPILAGRQPGRVGRQRELENVAGVGVGRVEVDRRLVRAVERQRCLDGRRNRVALRQLVADDEDRFVFRRGRVVQQAEPGYVRL
jgi:hypothetical protein